MPQMMMPNIQQEKRTDFVAKMISTLLEHGSVGMSEEEKKSFHEKMTEKSAHYSGAGKNLIFFEQ